MSDQLTPEDLQVRFEQLVIPRYIERQRDGARGLTSGPPRFVSVGGQPGAGKGRVLDKSKSSLPGAVVINGDELRLFHPAYERLMREEPLRMPEVTALAAGTWVGMSNEYLREQGCSAIVETTLRDAAMLRREFEAFKAAGFETELRVVAVPLEVSRAATVSRYVEQVKDFGGGRWTPSAAHDVAAGKVAETVSVLVSSGVVDRVVVQDRHGGVFHDAFVSAGGVTSGAKARAAVDNARDIRSLSEGDARSWIEDTKSALNDRMMLGEDDPDLLATAQRLASVDVKAVVVQAFPDNIEAQRKVVEQFSVFRVSSIDRGLWELSFPTSATEADRRPHAGPSAPAPRQIHRGPGIDGPGVSR